MFDINNRRYAGSKYKLLEWIKDLIDENREESKSFFDVFAGASVVAESMMDKYDEFFINDIPLVFVQ